jgi:steroid delta-isomerase-like uncharacterized protein
LTERENEKIVEKIFEDMNRHDDLEAVFSHYSDDITGVLPSGTIIDKEEMRRRRPIGFMAACPDLKFRIDRMVSQGDTVWVEYTATGTHKGDLFGIPATNKKFEYQSVFIYDIEAGKVKRYKCYFSMLRFLKQIQEKAVSELWDKMRKQLE